MPAKSRLTSTEAGTRGGSQAGASGAQAPRLRRSGAASRGDKMGRERLGGELEEAAGEAGADAVPQRQAMQRELEHPGQEEEARALPSPPLDYYLEDEWLGMRPGHDYISDAAAGSASNPPMSSTYPHAVCLVFSPQSLIHVWYGYLVVWPNSPAPRVARQARVLASRAHLIIRSLVPTNSMTGMRRQLPQPARTCAGCRRLARASP